MNPDWPRLVPLIIFSTCVIDFLVGWRESAGSQRNINRLFALASVLIGLCGFSLAFINLFRDSSPVALIGKHTYALSICFLPPVLYHLIIYGIGFPDRDSQRRESFVHQLRNLAYTFSLGLFLVSVKGGTFSISIVEHSRILIPQIDGNFRGIGYVYLFLMASALVAAHNRYRDAIGEQHKKRIKFLSVSSASTGAIFALLFFDGFIDSPNAAFLFVFCLSTLLLRLIAFSLTPVGFAGVVDLGRKFIVDLFTSSAMVLALVLTQVTTNAFLSAEIMVINQIYAVMLASIVAGFLIFPNREKIENYVESTFYPSRYNQKKRIRDLSRDVLSTQDRAELLDILFGGLSLSDTGFGSICLLLRDPGRPFFRIERSFGLKNDLQGYPLSQSSALIELLEDEKTEIFFDEMTERVMPDWQRRELSGVREVLEADVCFPLFSKRGGSLFGFIALGNPKIGRAAFYGRNLFWLQNLIINTTILLGKFFHAEMNNTLKSYLDPNLLKTLRQRKNHQEPLPGEEIWTAILLVDIRSFTPLSRTLTSKQKIALVKEFRSSLLSVVFKHGGSVDKFMGDSILAVFGLNNSPSYSEPDNSAAKCALEMIETVKILNECVMKPHFNKEISVGIAISSGVVTSGDVDALGIRENTILGDAVNMVARIEAEAKASEIILSPSTFRKIKDIVVSEELPPRDLQGFGPVALYKLISLRQMSGSPAGDARSRAVNE